jgi:signal transduction histidine kinase
METKLTNDELIEELKYRFQQNKNAYEELGLLTKQLKEVNNKLRESEALKTHFISNITNEIINPFASILGLSKNILNIKEGNWERVKTMAKLIHSEAFYLDFQLKNIFAAAELEAGETFPQIAFADINHIIETVIENFVHEIEKKKLNINYTNNLNLNIFPDNNSCFPADNEKLQLILSNLISNAIRYSDFENTLEIKAWNNDEFMNISVKDYGIGISEENQKIIFDRFKRVDPGINSINRGHGLGLSVTKAFIELFDGIIEIDSKIQEGTKFIISLYIPDSQIEVDGFATNGNEIFFDDEDAFFSDNDIF